MEQEISFPVMASDMSDAAKLALAEQTSYDLGWELRVYEGEGVWIGCGDAYPLIPGFPGESALAATRDFVAGEVIDMLERANGRYPFARSAAAEHEMALRWMKVLRSLC